MALSPFQLAAGGKPTSVAPAPMLPRPRRRANLVPSRAYLERRAAAAKPEERRSFLGQLKDTFTGVIPGAAHLVKSAAVAGVAPIRAGIDFAQGDISGADAIQAAIPGLDATRGFLGDDKAAARAAIYNPLGSEFGDSMQQTLGNIRHPSRYKDAWDEGRIVGTVLNDAGNAALIGGVASKVAGTAGQAAGGAATATGRTLGAIERGGARVSSLGNTISDAPLAPIRGASRWARSEGSLLRRAGGVARNELIDTFDFAKAGEYGPRIQARSQAFAKKYPRFASEEARFLVSGARDADRAARRAQTKVTRVLNQAVGAADLTVEQQGAVTAIWSGLAAQVDNLVKQGIPVEQARLMTTIRDIPEQTLTPEVAKIAQAYMDGTIDPDLADRMDSYAVVVNDVIQRNTDRALGGEGRPGGTLDPRQLGADPLTERVDEAIRTAGGKGLDANGNLIDPADQALYDQVLDSPEVYPAAWRPAMRSAGLARQEAAAQGLNLNIPLRPADMLAAGMAQPNYMPGGRSDLVQPLSVGTGRVPTREGMSPVRGVRSENMRAASEIQPFSARTIAERAGEEARRTMMNERVVQLIQDPKIKTVADIIPAQRRAELMQQAEREALVEMQGRQGPFTQERVAYYYGQALTEELSTQFGHEVLPGDRNNPQVGDFNPDDKATYSRINDTSIALPAGLKDRLTPNLRPADMGKFFNALAKINSKFKGSVLPFSVRWQLGDAIGGAFMAWSGGGINPAQLFSAMTQLKTLDDAAVRAIFDDLQDSGLNLEEARWMQGSAELGTPTTKIGKAWRRGGDIRRASFRLNESINRFNRQGYALAKLQQLMDQRGLSFDDALQNQAWDAPDVQQAITDAVDDANKIMGTFDEMTPFERNYVRNVLPFWCVDEATEALTKRGWVDGRTIREGDQVLSMNPADGQLHWALVHEVNRKHYAGDMFHLRGRNIDALVTPGHKFVVDHQLIPVEELRQRHTITTMGAPLDGTKTFTDSFVELVGWAVTEGHYRRGRVTVEITQKDGTLTCERIAEVLKECDAQWHTYRSGVRLAIRTFGVSGDMAKAIRIVAPNRVMTMEFLAALSPEQRVMLIGTMIAADGHHAQRSRSDVPVFTQKDEAATDAFVTLCSMAGFQTYKRRREKNTFGEDRVVWNVSVRNTDCAAVRHLEGWSDPGAPRPSEPPRQHYDGMVWCPRTDYGTFVCRRNGIVYVTGNTWNRHITQLAFRTAVDNPARMMWTMRLGQYGADQEDADLLPWQAGSIQVGNRLVPTNFVNPFNDIGGGSIFTPGGFLKGTSPGIKVGAAALFGKDLNRGLADITRPYDAKGLDELGRGGGSRMLSPMELAYQVIRQAPQGRALLNVAPTGAVGTLGLGPHPRYGSGEFMVNRRGNPIDTESRWQSLFGLVGLQGSGDSPLLGSLADNEQIIAARDRRLREANRRAQNTVRFEG